MKILLNLYGKTLQVIMQNMETRSCSDMVSEKIQYLVCTK